MDTQNHEEVVDQTKEDTPQIVKVTKKTTWKDWIVPVGAGIVIFAGCIAEYCLGLKTGRRQMYTVFDRDLETFKQSLEPEEWEDFKDKYNNSGVRVHVIN